MTARNESGFSAIFILLGLIVVVVLGVSSFYFLNKPPVQSARVAQNTAPTPLPYATPISSQAPDQSTINMKDTSDTALDSDLKTMDTELNSVDQDMNTSNTALNDKETDLSE